MTVSLIVAASQNGIIGADNKLPWHLPADLKRFKQLTMGHPILMGRKTFESIGKPLSGRTNIIISRKKDYTVCGAMVVNTLEEALLYCENEPEVFVIGGAEVFAQTLPFADRIYLTTIHQDFKGDTRLFPVDPNLWKETSREEFLSESLPHSFITLQRK